MRLQLFSDLHLESEDFDPTPAPGAELLVLAGDIDSGWDALARFAHWPVPVLMVAGNHEFDGRDLRQSWADLRAFAASHGIRLIERESVVITSYPIATTDVVEGTGLSLIDASVTGHAVAVDLETPALPEHIQACGIILDVEGPSPPQTLRIRPSVAEVGTLIVMETEGTVRADFVDLTGRIVTEIRLAPSGTGVLSTADLWPGTWLLRSWNAQGDLIGTARIQLF